MKIKQIEIVGFKSFPERTIIHILPGITGIVGPNGCGKSNIVDAIRWALGEQSLSLLRGKTIDDIIFCGSDSKKPLSMAEVTVTFMNDGNLPPPYADYSEIEIKRRVYRSGESEYFINRIPCRLKDIAELFLDTGAGIRAYSIIEQGKIGSLLNAKPDELRGFLDEVAGIAKYRFRKRVALKKMEATLSNLQRVTDILGEIKRQLNSLERQAKKAERFKKLREELRELDLKVSYTIYRKTKNEHDEIENIALPLREKQKICELKIMENETKLEEKKLLCTEIEKDIMEIQKLLNEKRHMVQLLENKIMIANERINNIKKEHMRLTDEASFIQLQLKELAEESEALLSKRTELKQQHENELSQSRYDEGMLDEIKTKHRILLEQIEKGKDRLIQLLVGITGTVNSIQAIEKKMEILGMEKEKKQREYLAENTKLMELENRTRQMETLINELENQISSKRIEQEGLKQRLEELQKEFKNAYAALRDIQDRRERLEARVGALKDIQKNFEGLKAGIKDVMLKKNENFNGIRELVADIFDGDHIYLKCVESVLGEKLQSIIVDSVENSISALIYLKEKGNGRLTFIPLSLGSVGIDMKGPFGEGVKGPLINFIKVREGYEDLGRKLLEGVLLIESLDIAYKIWSEGMREFILTTLDGDVIYPSGIITGGYGEEAVVEYIKRKGEIKELERMIEALRSEEEKEAANVDVLKSELERLEGRLNETSSYLEATEKIFNQHKRELENHKLKIANVNLRIQVLKEEMDQAEKDQHSLRIEKQKLEDEHLRLEGERSGLDSLVKRLQEEEKTVRMKIEEIEKGISEFKARTFSINELIERLNEDLEKVESKERKLRDLLSKKEREISEKHTELKSTECEIIEYGNKLSILKKEVVEIEERLKEKSQAHEDMVRNIKEAEEDLKVLRAELSGIEREVRELDYRLMELRLKMENMIEQIKEKYSLNLGDLEYEMIKEEEFDQSINRLNEVREKIQQLGDVNMESIREYDEIKQRFLNMMKQKEDLENALKDLNNTIERINSITKEKFIETFNKVNAKFKEVFARLFSGGNAELILTDPQNLLESGVEAVVQPPGKKLQNMNLLSGGEKALAAISLIFSLFLIKPSPFCILDEVDAPLDERNLERFISFIKELSRDIQFILITHNRRTMEIADCLYGITMETAGISRLVSVKLF